MRKQRFAEDGDARAAVVEDVLIVLGFRLRVDGNGHGANLDRAEKGVEKFWRVEKQKEYALLGPNAESKQGVAGAVGILQQFLIRDSLIAALDSDFGAAAFLDVAVHEVSGNIENFRQRDQEIACFLTVCARDWEVLVRKRARV